jgi:hypothetical protein
MTRAATLIGITLGLALGTWHSIPAQGPSDSEPVRKLDAIRDREGLYIPPDDLYAPKSWNGASAKNSAGRGTVGGNASPGTARTPAPGAAESRRPGEKTPAAVSQDTHEAAKANVRGKAVVIGLGVLLGAAVLAASSAWLVLRRRRRQGRSAATAALALGLTGVTPRRAVAGRPSAEPSQRRRAA